MGKKLLGFLNPWLYSRNVSMTFTDITVGRSAGCNGNEFTSYIPGNPGIIPGAGWDGVEGWDPITGHRTPDFEKLKALL